MPQKIKTEKKVTTRAVKKGSTSPARKSVKIKKTPTVSANETAEFAFLSDTLSKMVLTKNHYDIRSEIILGISSIIFIFCLGYILSDNEKGLMGFLIIAIASLFSCITSLYSVITPSLFQEETTKKSLMHHGFLSQFTQEEAIVRLKDITMDKAAIIEQYSREIYNIARNSIEIKKRLNKRAVTLLIWGLTIGFILILFLP